MKLYKDKKIILGYGFLFFLAVFFYLAVMVHFFGEDILVHDERGFFSTGQKLFKAFFIDHDFSSSIWQEDFQNYGAHNPRVALYFIGAIQYVFDFFHSQIGTYLSYEMFLRYSITFFAALSVLFVWLFFLRTGKMFAAFLGCFLLCVNPVFLSTFSAVTNDIFMFMFSVAALFCLSLAEDNYPHRRIAIIMFGILSGFALSCKLYAFTMYITFVFCSFFYLRVRNFTQVLLDVIIVTVLIPSVFTITNPLLYRDFFQGIELLTVSHVGYDVPFIFSDLLSIKHLFVYPYLLVSFRGFSIAGIIDQPALLFSDYLMIFSTYILVVRGIYLAFIQKKYTHLCFYAASHLWMVYPVMVFKIILIPKMFILVVLAVIYMVALAVSDLFFSLKDYIKQKKDVV
nr:hypothetical protein 3 [bacterium]